MTLKMYHSSIGTPVVTIDNCLRISWTCGTNCSFHGMPVVKAQLQDRLAILSQRGECMGALRVMGQGAAQYQLDALSLFCH